MKAPTISQIFQAIATFIFTKAIRPLKNRYLLYKISKYDYGPTEGWTVGDNPYEEPGPCSEYLNEIFAKPYDKEKIAFVYETWGDRYFNRKRRRIAHKLLNIK